QDAKLHNEFTLLLEKRLVARFVQRCQIVRMHKFAGLAAPHLEAAFREAENYRAPGRQVHKRAGKVDGEAANPSGLAGEFELGFALDQCQFYPLALGDVALAADPSEGPPDLIE